MRNPTPHPRGPRAPRTVDSTQTPLHVFARLRQPAISAVPVSDHDAQQPWSSWQSCPPGHAPPRGREYLSRSAARGACVVRNHECTAAAAPAPPPPTDGQQPAFQPAAGPAKRMLCGVEPWLHTHTMVATAGSSQFHQQGRGACSHPGLSRQCILPSALDGCLELLASR